MLGIARSESSDTISGSKSNVITWRALKSRKLSTWVNPILKILTNEDGSDSWRLLSDARLNEKCIVGIQPETFVSAAFDGREAPDLSHKESSNMSATPHVILTSATLNAGQ